MAILLREHNFTTSVLTEGEGQAKNWFIEGIMAQADVVNRNRRKYPKSIMESAFQDYHTNQVLTNGAVGELMHPNTPELNTDRISHRIVRLEQDGANWVGKAMILNTPTGNIVKGLLEGGVRLGVSTRGTGSVVAKNGINEVAGDFRLAAIDIVMQPSAPDAFVQGLMEHAPFVWNTLEEDVEFLESMKSNIKVASKAELAEAKVAEWDRFLKFLATK